MGERWLKLGELPDLSVNLALTPGKEREHGEKVSGSISVCRTTLRWHQGGFPSHPMEDPCGRQGLPQLPALPS